MADMLQMEIGDYAFLWETKRNDQKSRIYGILKIICLFNIYSKWIILFITFTFVEWLGYFDDNKKIDFI